MSREDMPTEIEIPKAFEKARKKIVKNFNEKGNSWTGMHPDTLEDLLLNEVNEFLDSYERQQKPDPDELLDIMNLAAMLHDRLLMKDWKEQDLFA